MDEAKLAKFLEKIKMIESSGGIDLNHKTMESGMHEGHSAYGSYGLMPNTIQEFVNRARMRNKGQVPEIYQNIYKQDSDVVKQALEQNPEIENQLANEIALHLFKRAKSPDDAAYRWNMGHNMNPDKITPEMLDSHPYVQKFRSLQKIGTK